MIQNPETYTSKGAKLHKGVLLHGKPGTGKTLLARAIAGESGTSFLYCTGSSFDEMFVGVGAKRVRELFSEARKVKPCIIFIDEIDTLLSKSRRYGNEHSSSRSTINQMLSEMDGFTKNDGILVIGATNH
jgi:ATP-dependent Zn protease